MKCIATFVVALVSVSAVAKADVIDQIKDPFSTSSVGGFISSYSMLDTGVNSQYGLAYDNFTFASDMTVTQIDWIGAYDGDSSTDDGVGGFLTDPDLINPSFTISIYSDNVLTPGTPGSPAAAVFSVASGASSETAITPMGGEDFFYSYSAPVSFNATAGERYWVSISAEMDYALNGWGLAHSIGSTDGDGLSVYDFGGNRSVDGFDYAIRVTAVPEPGAGLMLATVAGIALIRRRRNVY